MIYMNMQILHTDYSLNTSLLYIHINVEEVSLLLWE